MDDLMPNLPPAPTLSDAIRHAFAPYGAMRVGLAVGNTISAVWNKPDPATGRPAGPSVDMAHAFAAWLGIPLEEVPLASSGEIIATADADRWDIAFTPVDAERKAAVDFTTDYYRGDSTYLVRKNSPYRGVADVDHDGAKVVGVENTATLRGARRTLTKVEARGVGGPEEALALFRSGEADAVALGRESLLSLIGDVPEGRILPDHFHAAGTALAMPKGRGEALEIATEFIEAAKAGGLAAEIVARHGLPAESVAPVGARS